MKMHFSMLATRNVILIIACLLFCLLLQAETCDIFGELTGGQTAKDIKQETNFDVNSPTEVTGAIIGAQVIGDKNIEDALIPYRGIRRADYEQKGDQARDNLRIEEARKNYEEALKWSDTSTKEQTLTKIQLYYRMSYTYDDEARSAGLDTLKGRDADRKSIEYTMKGVDLIPPDMPESKADMYAEVAEKLMKYDKNKACNLVAQALSMKHGSYLFSAGYHAGLLSSCGR